MASFKSFYHRIYNDYFMKSRLDEYEEIIIKSLEKGYEFITLKDYYVKLNSRELGSGKYFILRHDIDTDLRTTRRMFEIEQKHKVQSTYYFRLSTINIPLMKEIDAFESEASYHFEEIAQYCKDKYIKTKEEAVKKIEEIRKVFKENFKKLEDLIGIKFHTVAAHGDFVNKKIGLTSSLITEDRALREELMIKCESYDEILLNSFSMYISDVQYPVFYSPENIFDSIGRDQVICFLVHPRNWCSNGFVNTKDNLKRLYEGLKWR